jgi:hypothetical protein
MGTIYNWGEHITEEEFLKHSKVRYTFTETENDTEMWVRFACCFLLNRLKTQNTTHAFFHMFWGMLNTSE